MNERQVEEYTHLTWLIYSCWLLSASTKDEAETIPDDPTVWARVLWDAREEGIFPQWARKQFHFNCKNNLFECTTFSVIDNYALQLNISGYDFSKQQTSILIDRKRAIRWLFHLVISEESAVAWGKFLRESYSKHANINAVSSSEAQTGQ